MPIQLQGTPSVDGYDMPLPVHNGGRRGNVAPVQGHRPVAHNDPPFERMPLPHEIVVLHTAIGVQFLQPLLPGDPAVNE